MGCKSCTIGRALDDALIRGDSIASVARTHDLSERAVSRHLRVCIPRLAALARESQLREHGTSVQEATRHVFAEASRLGRIAEERKDVRTALLALREYARAADLVMRSEAQEHAIDVTRSAQWAALREAILVALEPFPDAHASVVAAMRKLHAAETSVTAPGGLLEAG